MNASILLKTTIGAGLMLCSLTTTLLTAQTSTEAIAPSASVTAIPAATPTAVTTTGGTSGLLPVFTGASTIANSNLYFTTGKLGIGKAPAVALDIAGSTSFNGQGQFSQTGTATTTSAWSSNALFFQSSVYNTSSAKAVSPFFEMRSQPVSNNSTSAGAQLHFIYGNGVAAAADTGFYLNSNGTVHFAPAQTFPIASNGITSVTHDASLTGAGTGASPLGIAAISHSSNFTGNGTSASPLALSSPLNLSGSAYAKGFYGSNYTANYAAVEGDDYSNNGVGVEGLSFNEGSGYQGYGMVAEGYIGIYAYGSHYAGDFDGNVYVGGTLSKAGGSFKIDDPIDPANKYLSHSFVESPDMMNIYNGNIITDGKGEAIVTMPDYFEALNQDFRYQLTVMGQFAQAIVGSEISGNIFIIKTDKPNVKVSWQVTGIRHDAWANAHRIPNEEVKPTKEKGRYLHPELFGHMEQMSIAARTPVSR